MSKAMGTIYRISLVLTIAVGLTVGFSSAQESDIDQAESNKVSKKPSSSPSNQAPASLFPTLGVLVDSCYVFLNPRKGSLRFGPLVKGEKIKRLDAYKSWVHVWIPRLLISGWVLRTEVYQKGETIADEGSIPLNLLTILMIVGQRANIRKAPTTKSSIILTAERGQEFWLLNQKKGWFQIGMPTMKKKGWVHGSLVSRKQKK